MGELFYPFATGPGANADEVAWGNIFLGMGRPGVLRGEANNFLVSAPGGAAVRVATGRAVCFGHYYELTAQTGNLTVAANAGATRFDNVVIRFDFSADSATVVVVTGTTGGPPALQANRTGQYDILLAIIAVPTGASITTGAITPATRWALPVNPLVIACAVPTSTNTISNNNWTPIPFTSTEDYDTANIHAASPSSHFTVPTGYDGLWTFGVAFAWDNDPTGDRGIQIWKNGSLHSQGPILPASNGSGIDTVMAWDYEDAFAQGDYIEWYVSQDSGGPLNVISGRATARYIGPLV